MSDDGPEVHPVRGRPRVEARCFPTADLDFRRDVQQVIADSWETAANAEKLLDLVQAKLGLKYPQALIAPRDGLAELGAEDWATWYVYRDGRAA